MQLFPSATAALAAACFGLAACAGSLETSPTPSPRAGGLTMPNLSLQAGFERWVAVFRPRALADGVSTATWQRAMTGLAYDPDVIRRDRNQSEFDQQIWDYLDIAVSQSRVDNGKAELAQQRALFAALQTRYGVEKEILAAIWGMETNYGRQRGGKPIIPALATLAYDGRRGAFFEQQLVAALLIVQAGDTDPAHLVGSWAGAMGHTQFIPTSYLEHAVDFTGDGKRDIWGENPADALASTAAYLAHSGWVTGQPWGVEVVLPAGFPYALTGKKNVRPFADWVAKGVRLPGGVMPPNHGPAAILLPAGARGPAFLVFSNFYAISHYNTADAYIVGVGHLADRLRGGGPITGTWPRGERALSLSERVELQRRLTAAGFSTQGADGKIGPNTIAAIAAFQHARGLVADGHATTDVLEALR